MLNFFKKLTHAHANALSAPAKFDGIKIFLWSVEKR
jgi:hypothetical protein